MILLMSEAAREDGQGWVDGATMAAPGLLGAAAGLLLGELMHTSARRPAIEAPIPISMATRSLLDHST